MITFTKQNHQSYGSTLAEPWLQIPQLALPENTLLQSANGLIRLPTDFPLVQNLSLISLRLSASTCGGNFSVGVGVYGRQLSCKRRVYYVQVVWRVAVLQVHQNAVVYTAPVAGGKHSKDFSLCVGGVADWLQAPRWLL